MFYFIFSLSWLLFWLWLIPLLDKTCNCQVDCNSLSPPVMFSHIIFILFLHAQLCSLKSIIQIFWFGNYNFGFLEISFGFIYVPLNFTSLSLCFFIYLSLHFIGLFSWDSLASYLLLRSFEGSLKFSETFLLVLQLNQIQAFAHSLSLQR